MLAGQFTGRIQASGFQPSFCTMRSALGLGCAENVGSLYTGRLPLGERYLQDSVAGRDGKQSLAGSCTMTRRQGCGGQAKLTVEEADLGNERERSSCGSNGSACPNRDMTGLGTARNHASAGDHQVLS